MIYRLPEYISKEIFYNKILPDLTKQYRDLKIGDRTEVSLVETKKINSNALPLLAGMLNLLQNKSQNPVFVELVYNPRLLAFLDTIGFFEQLFRYGIIEYDKEYIGDLWNYHYNRENKLWSYLPISYFEDIFEEEKQNIRDSLAEKVRGELCCKYFFRRETTPIEGDELWNTVLISCTELIVNAVIYSGSISYSYMQSGMMFNKNRKGHILSIVDVGKGYYESLGDKIRKGGGYTQREREKFYEYAQMLGIDIVREINFLSIMEALYYSQTISREMNLYKLKNLLAVSNANLRIHQRNREVVFTSAYCYKCQDRDILSCLKCVWKRKNNDKSPLKIYPIVMAGVHIEIEFVQEKKYV